MILSPIIGTIIIIAGIYYIIYSFFAIDIYGEPVKKIPKKVPNKLASEFERVHEWKKYKIDKIIKPPLLCSKKIKLKTRHKSRYHYEKALEHGKCPICYGKLTILFLYDPKDPLNTNNVSMFACYTCRKRTEIEQWY